MINRLVTKFPNRFLLSPCRFYNPYLTKKSRRPSIWGTGSYFANKMSATEPSSSIDANKANNNATPEKGANSIVSQVPGKLYKPIVWIDCEMTGLDHINDKIIEICCIITDGHLNIVDENGYESVIHYDNSVMDKMGEWCTNQHGKSGLTQKVLDSTKTRDQVEDELLNYIKKWIPEERKGVLAGNSVHMDRLFMIREFPRVIDHLFYRIIDVSSIMEVARRHNPQLSKVSYKKKGAHTAKADILESIEQLKFYQNHYFKNETETKEFVDMRTAEIQKEQLLEQQKEIEDAKVSTAAAEITTDKSEGNKRNTDSVIELGQQSESLHAKKKTRNE